MYTTVYYSKPQYTTVDHSILQYIVTVYTSVYHVTTSTPRQIYHVNMSYDSILQYIKMKLSPIFFSWMTMGYVLVTSWREDCSSLGGLSVSAPSSSSLSGSFLLSLPSHASHGEWDQNVATQCI